MQHHASHPLRTPDDREGGLQEASLPSRHRLRATARVGAGIAVGAVLLALLSEKSEESPIHHENPLQQYDPLTPRTTPLKASAEGDSRRTVVDQTIPEQSPPLNREEDIGLEILRGRLDHLTAGKRTAGKGLRETLDFMMNRERSFGGLSVQQNRDLWSDIGPIRDTLIEINHKYQVELLRAQIAEIEAGRDVPYRSHESSSISLQQLAEEGYYVEFLPGAIPEISRVVAVHAGEHPDFAPLAHQAKDLLQRAKIILKDYRPLRERLRRY
ncbi:hypothetical protein MRY87_12785 [bacterium]|nr:hypothetical protein [bacterium]